MNSRRDGRGGSFNKDVKKLEIHESDPVHQSFLKRNFKKKKKTQKQSLHHSLLYIKKRRDLTKMHQPCNISLTESHPLLDGVELARSHSPTPPAHSVLICSTPIFPHSPYLPDSCGYSQLEKLLLKLLPQKADYSPGWVRSHEPMEFFMVMKSR